MLFADAARDVELNFAETAGDARSEDWDVIIKLKQCRKQKFPF